MADPHNRSENRFQSAPRLNRICLRIEKSIAGIRLVPLIIILAISIDQAIGSESPGQHPFRGKIMFFGSVPADDPGSTLIEMMNPDGTKRQTVVKLRGSIYSGRIAPDGSKLAFGIYDTQVGRNILWALDVSGHFREMAFESAAAAWSPDGTQLACYMITGDQWGSFAVDVARQRHGRLPIRESDAVEDWSPDGREFSVMAENAGRKFKHAKLGKLPLHQIYVISTDGSHRTMLTPETTQDASWSRFSPDSSRIAYNLRRYPDQEKPPVQSGVVRGRDGANPKEIIRFADLGDQKHLARPLGGPCWSPDGKSVVWRVVREHRDGSAAANNSRFELVFVTLSDGAIKRFPLEAPEISVWGELDWR